MENNNANQHDQSTQQDVQTTGAVAPFDMQTFANSLAAAIDLRTQRAENSVVKSFSKQYGLEEGEITRILEAEKAKRDNQPTPGQQKAIDEAMGKVSTLLVNAEVRSVGAEMGLVDTDAAMLLMDRDGIKVDDNGTVTGVKESLEKLKESKGYLFSVGTPWGIRHEGAPPVKTGVEAAFEKLNPELKVD